MKKPRATAGAARRRPSVPARVQEAPDQRTLLHELEVHRTELEVQNKELQAARLDMERALKRSTEVFEMAPVPYFILESESIIVELNVAAGRLLDSSRFQLVGRRFDLFVSEDQRPTFARFLRRVLTTDPEEACQEACELQFLNDRGESLEVHVTAAVLPGPRGTALVTVQDVTARKRAEAALQLESRRKDDFLAMLSHELRNPLEPIRNSLHVATHLSGDSPPMRNALAVIDRQVMHLTRIVDDLLDVSRIARRKIRLRRERIEVRDAVMRAVNDHRTSFEARHLRLDLRAGSEPLWVDADPTRLAQIMGNLLGNAAKFTPPGGRVDVVVSHDGASLSITIYDTGVGLSPEVRSQLFQPFTQAPQSLDRTIGGLGLGLATVRGLVELHGGTVEVSSGGLGRGSEFTVRLPLVQGPAQSAPPGEARPKTRHRVLIIEDNVDSADSLRMALEIEGHEVQVAYDGRAGLATARTFKPDVIICDIGLPGMNGYAVARELRRRRHGESYLIALSGYAQAEDLRLATEAGFDQHLAKPASIAALQALMDRVPDMEHAPST